ncbi:hypothetical protein SAMN02745131_03998 [Flavisolibacter ginsengisoli DSM 18119]|jgi:hypothetical protein|uniref:Uncharacterized protein n=1 Tax=Flavisolibacter ginsengisoli DSM 18119 TaxID=1121884 RepID=A0A1M5FYP7_9BACT|nr:hypothetical protein SAMN02745131_03998 [Flavisolibacter ginsengisoli DSM 18119]
MNNFNVQFSRKRELRLIGLGRILKVTLIKVQAPGSGLPTPDSIKAG